MNSPATKRFYNKHVVITGAARGIGLEIARHFAKEGAVLSLLDHHPENLAATANELKSGGAEAYAFITDVTDREEVLKQ